MEHVTVYKRDGWYTLGPVPTLLPDGRLAVGCLSSPFGDHFGLTDWIVLVSDDEGRTFRQTEDPTIPLTWPGANPRERYDRYAAILHDGTYLATGTVGFEVWSAERKDEALADGLYVHAHPNGGADRIIVGAPRIFVQRSHNRGRTWEREERWVAGLGWLTAFPRAARLSDGTILVPMYGRNQAEDRGQDFVWRSADAGETWRLYPMATSVSDLNPDEFCLFGTAPDQVLALIRHATKGSQVRKYLLQSWSNDGGVTWSYPLRTDIVGHPPSICRLHDGRLLCSVTYRFAPMGIHCILSNDNGRSWDASRTIVLREDAGTRSSAWKLPRPTEGPSASDVGYPITVQFSDGTLFTCYWITLDDGVTHVAATRWRLDEV